MGDINRQSENFPGQKKRVSRCACTVHYLAVKKYGKKYNAPCNRVYVPKKKKYNKISVISHIRAGTPSLLASFNENLFRRLVVLKIFSTAL